MSPKWVEVANLTEQLVYFVDDEPKVQKVAGRTLERAGLKVRCFSCAADCLEQLRSRPCDLLITDVKMPGMDGLTLIKSARGIKSDIRAILMTAYGDDYIRQEVESLEDCDYVEKPFDPEILIDLIKKECCIEKDAYSGSELGPAA